MKLILKPCPFCGGNGLLCRDKHYDGYDPYEIHFVKCVHCGCSTSVFITDGHFGANTSVQDAIDAWNRRIDKE